MLFRSVKVNDHFQSVFPPDVHAVFDHGKRDVSEFPIANGTYYKVNYAPGTDISRYKNIPVPTSYMAINSKYNFVGGYENDSKGGLLHIANHHVSPGKKQWTWGHSDFGRAWDRNLTDDDGPYIELMCGVYTDNQPDFSWLMPGEEKSFSQFFMPYRDIGVVKNATKEAMVNLEFEPGFAIVKIYTTAAYPSSTILLKSGSLVLLEEVFDFHPGTSFDKRVVIPFDVDPQDVAIMVKSSSGRILVSWQPEKEEKKAIPEAAKPAKLPEEVESVEQLYLTGLHLEQYRHATYDPRDYYLEALRRDPKDSRCNNAMGRWLLRHGKFQEAEQYFRRAIATLTERNPNPLEGEPFYNLGLSLRFQGHNEAAYDAFYKSVWNDAYMASGYFQLARLECLSGNWEDALEVIDRSLIKNWHDHKVRHLKVCILRKLGKVQEADSLIRESLVLDKFNFGILFESCLLHAESISGENFGNSANVVSLKTLLRGNIHTYIEFALDYAHAGLFPEAIQLISIGIQEQPEGRIYPLALYFLAWFEAQVGDLHSSTTPLKVAATTSPDFCFPNQIEAVMVLEWAKNQNSDDPKAPYYLGNFWYNARQYENAINNWELSASRNDDFPTIHRNLALAYFNKLHDPSRALFELEKAFSLNPFDARVLMELDQLYKRLNYSASDRLALLDKYPALVDFRDDLYLEKITLLNLLGQHQKAYNLIMSRKFHPWEGGEGKVTGQYILSLMGIAVKAIENRKFTLAIDFLVKAQYYPENLGEGKLFGAAENQIHYWLGCAFEGMDNHLKAEEHWQIASEGISEPLPAIFYNDQQPDTIYFQGLALARLRRKEAARSRFETLIQFGKAHLEDQFKLDYFAVSLPDLQIWEDDLTKRNRQNCIHLIELGEKGLRNIFSRFFNDGELKDLKFI